MTKPASDAVFTGSIADLYDAELVPMFFAPYADDLAQRIAALDPSRVLEVAAGTGAVTRALDRALPPEVEVVATDLNQAMLDRAQRTGTQREVRWQQANGLSLPFDDAGFDVVACQFGVMFFPDRAAGFREAGRVLRSGGSYVFNVWDRLEVNELTAIAQQALGALFPRDPPRFMERTPHGYFERDVILDDLRKAGYDPRAARFETVTHRSPATSAQVAARALCQGTPLRGEIESRGDLEAATAACAAALAQRFGTGPIEGRIQAHVIVVSR